MKNTTKILLIIVLVAIFLRLFRLDTNPPSLNWDEVSLGYNAYAILTTGYDEFGEHLPLSRFIAFGDYKPPGYIYATVLSMAVFGVNEFAVRFPSALSGIVMVIGAYFLATTLTKNKAIGVVTAFLLTFSPWSLQLSRAAFESHMAAVLNMLGIALLYWSIKTKKGFLIPVAIFLLSLAFYTFNANRIITPLIIVFMGVLFFKELWQMKKWLIVSLFLGILLVLPSISYLQSRESKLRFHEVSIFTSLDTVKKANDRIARSGNTVISRLLHNRRVYFLRDFISHYIDHFKGGFLFVTGDQNPRLSIQDSGELYLYELPFLVIGGVIFLLQMKRREKAAWLIVGWLAISIVPAAMARETPHMLRIASVLPTLQIMTATGMIYVFRKLRDSPIYFGIILSVVVLLFVGQCSYFMHNYWVHYPYEWSGQWQFGYKEMVQAVRKYEKDYDRVVVTSHYGRPYIYFLFYNQINPLTYVNQRRADRDWYGLWNVYGFGKYDFSNENVSPIERVLYVSTPRSFSDQNDILEIIKAPNGEVVFEIGQH